MTTGDEEDVDSGWDVGEEATDRKTRSFDTKALLAQSLTDSTKQPSGEVALELDSHPPSSGNSEPTSEVPTERARSFTPKVPHAAQEARRAEEGLRKTSETRKHTRPVPVQQRLPNVRSQQFVPPPNVPPPPPPPQAAGKTSLRFPNRAPARLDAQRRQTVKFSTKDLEPRESDEEPPVTVRAPLPTDPESAYARTTRRPPSNPLLDLHLPDDVTVVAQKASHGPRTDAAKTTGAGTTPVKTPKPVAKGTLRERLAKVFPESTLSPLPPKPKRPDSFSDLPIDEVLENVRQSQRPPPMSAHRATVDIDEGDRPSAIPEVEVEAESSDMNLEDLERLEKALSAVREKMEKKDFSGAMLRAEAVLEAWPDSVDARSFASECRLKLQEMYIQKIGSGRHMLRVAVDSVHGLAIDHRAGFLLSLIDGVATVDEVLDMSGMQQLDALRLLFEMVQEGVIESDAPLSARAESKN